MPGKSKFQISRSLDERIKRIIGGTNEYDTEFAQVSSALILGFNYGNITNCVGLTTNYQLHHAVFPVVGLVFFKASPTDEDIKAKLNSIKEYSCSPNGLGSFKSDKNEHLFLIYYVVNGTNEVEKRIFNFTKGTFVRRRRLRLNILDDPYCPRQVHKGPEELLSLGDGDSLASADDDQIDHLIFFIHGVGGVCDVRFRSCVEVVADFKKMANNLLAQHSIPSSGASTPTTNKQLANHLKKGFFRKHSSESTSQSSAQTEPSRSSRTSRTRRVECLPISWHSCTRRQTGMNDQLNLVSLTSVPKLRHFLNKVVMDALLYSSGPVYSQTIINNVGDEINRLYSLFMEKHPNFTGSISLAGHSLGSVIVFDLLAHQIPWAEDTCRSEDQSSNGNNNYKDSINNNNCNIKNNYGNTDNNHGKDRQDVNCRLTCRNVGHYHHDISAQGLDCCADYKNLESLLKDMDLTQYAEMFHKEHIDINTLLLLTDLDMKELNLPLGARRKLGTYINFKKVSNSVASVMQQKNNQRQQEQDIQEPSSTSDMKHHHHQEYGQSSSVLFDNMNTGQFLLKFPQLKFKPRCFFAFGSPMPMFLNVRGIEEVSKEYKLPTCDRMFNIFHPYDPLAYRIEPLIDPRFKSVEPVQIPHHKGGKRMHVQIREGFARVGHDIKHRLLGSLRNTWTSFSRYNTNDTSEPPETECPTKQPQPQRNLTKSSSSSVDVEVNSIEVNSPDSLKQKRPLKRQPIVRSQSEMTVPSLDSIIENSIRQDLEEAEEQNGGDSIVIGQFESMAIDPGSGCNSNDPSSSSGSKPVGDKKLTSENSMDFDQTTIGKLNGGRRLDYVLQEKPIELFNEYIFAFTSHANYWQNEDSALILLKEIYQVDNIQVSDQFE